MSCEIKGEDFEARAKEAERKAFQAAQHGQELLLKLEENAKILDQLTQEKHEMKMALQSKEAAVDALEEELQGKGKMIQLYATWISKSVSIHFIVHTGNWYCIVLSIWTQYSSKHSNIPVS